MELFNIKSRSEIIKCGVTHGSILRHLLFFIYVNDISNYTSLKLLYFADVNTISCSSTDIDNLHNIVNEELDALNQWFYANKLCLNVKKTKYILFRPSACFPNITNKHLYIDNKPISRVGDTEQEKSLGPIHGKLILQTILVPELNSHHYCLYICFLKYGMNLVGIIMT